MADGMAYGWRGMRSCATVMALRGQGLEREREAVQS